MPHKTTSLIPPKKPGYAISCLSWLPLPLTIRAHSWFLLPPFLLFSCISCVSCLSCFSWLTPDFVHSCPFVVLTLPSYYFRVFRVFRGLIFLWSFVSIRVHSWFLLSPPLLFFVPFVLFVVTPCFCPFVSISVH